MKHFTHDATRTLTTIAKEMNSRDIRGDKLPRGFNITGSGSDRKLTIVRPKFVFETLFDPWTATKLYVRSCTA